MKQINLKLHQNRISKLINVENIEKIEPGASGNVTTIHLKNGSEPLQVVGDAKAIQKTVDELVKPPAKAEGAQAAAAKGS